MADAAPEHVRDAVRLRVRERGVRAAERELTRLVRSADGEERDRALAALGWLRRQHDLEVRRR